MHSLNQWFSTSFAQDPDVTLDISGDPTQYQIYLTSVVYSTFQGPVLWQGPSLAATVKKGWLHLDWLLVNYSTSKCPTPSDKDGKTTD